jgi:hypothetical protein
LSKLEEWQKEEIDFATGKGKYKPMTCPKCGSNMKQDALPFRNNLVMKCTVCKWFKLYPIYPNRTLIKIDKTIPDELKLKPVESIKGFNPSIKIIDEKKFIKDNVSKNECNFPLCIETKCKWFIHEREECSIGKDLEVK